MKEQINEYQVLDKVVPHPEHITGLQVMLVDKRNDIETQEFGEIISSSPSID